MILPQLTLIEGLEMSNEIMEAVEDSTITKALDAAFLLTKYAGELDRDGKTEVFANMSDMKGETFGILLMQVMGANVLGDLNAIGAENKPFWVKVGAEMGPDWLHMLKHVAAFMAKVDEF